MDNYIKEYIAKRERNNIPHDEIKLSAEKKLKDSKQHLANLLKKLPRYTNPEKITKCNLTIKNLEMGIGRLEAVIRTLN